MFISSYAWPELGSTGRRIGCREIGQSLHRSIRAQHLHSQIAHALTDKLLSGRPHPNSSTILFASRARFLLRDCFFFASGCITKPGQSVSTRAVPCAW